MECCYVILQNYGYVVDGDFLFEGWCEWFCNVNDGLNEGICYDWKFFCSVQFYLEVIFGLVDIVYLFECFLEMVG